MSIVTFPTMQAARPRAPRLGLTDTELFAIAAASRRLPGYWLVQRDEDSRGHVSVALIGSDEGDATPSFVIERERGTLRVAHGRFANWRDLGGPCADVTEAMGRVRVQLGG